MTSEILYSFSNCVLSSKWEIVGLII